MAQFIDVAAIHFAVSERGDQGRDEAFRQFHEAETRLDGTPLDLLVTCEGMESIGQTMAQVETAMQPDGLGQLYRDFARRNSCTVAGSLKLSEGGKNYNALVYYGPDGLALGSYKKSFPTPPELAKGLSRGPGANVVETPAGRIGGAICFDLNFDELCRQYVKLQPQLLAFASMFHGGVMQNFWAYRIGCFMVSAVKDSLCTVIDPLGHTLATADYYTRIVRARINLDFTVLHLDYNMAKFPSIQSKYRERVRIDCDPESATAVLYCDAPEYRCSDIVREFELETLQHYLDRSRNS